MTEQQIVIIPLLLLSMVVGMLTAPVTAIADAWGIVFRNDVVAGTDRHLTSSIGINWIGDDSGQQEPDSWQAGYRDTLVDLFQLLPFTSLENKPFLPGINVEHDILTPSNTSRRELIVDDLPYAGFLSSTFFLLGAHNRKVEQYRLMIGLVGPAAGGEELQKGLHRLIGNKEPKGWDNQLDNEMVIGAGYTLGYRTWRNENRTGIHASWTNTAAIDIGTFADSATLGTVFQVGSNPVGNMIMIDSLSTGNTAVQFRSDAEYSGLGWTAFCGAYVSALGYVYYLDRDSDYDLSYDFLVGHGILGVNITFNRFMVSFALQGVRITLNETLVADIYGSISLSMI